MKSLRAHPGFRGDVDRERPRLVHELELHPGSAHDYQGLSKLPAGTLLSVDLGRAPDSSAPVRYWSAQWAAEEGVAHPLRLSEAEAIDELDRVVRDAVRLDEGRRSLGGVPVGRGFDSSTVVAAMQAQAKRPVRTFTMSSPSRT